MAASESPIIKQRNVNTFPYRAAIFDLDGVLADTEPLNFRAIQDMFDPQLIRLDNQDYDALYGQDYYSTAEYLRTKYKLKEPVESLIQRQEACAIRRIDMELEPAPGAVDLVRGLADRGIPLGLASNSPKIYVVHTLKRLGLDGMFPFPIGRDDVARGKPDPDPYLEACARLNVKPGGCLAIEDSEVGMRSALAAGLSVMMVGPQAPTSLPARVTRYPDLVALIAGLLGQGA